MGLDVQNKMSDEERGREARSVKIVVFGEPKPYKARVSPYIRKTPGKRGQPVGSLGINMAKPKAHEKYQARIRAAAQKAMWNEPMILAPVQLAVRAYVPIPKAMTRKDREAIRHGIMFSCKRPDMTNLIKLAEDALSGVVFADDNQVVRSSDNTGRYFSRWPRIEIEVTAISGPCALQAEEMAREDIEELKAFDPVGAAAYG